ncbi:gap junction delta-4 protein isoform X2 [Callorhinus ursinus]|uniref:Gap junction protein n=2 Tax=Callorhinus ursinus TaxID=34884 RepID=A0A3Q7RMB6_CALUR|nr:gap junction delta-4 protein isoform X2 [Callorhinus ursinus]
MSPAALSLRHSGDMERLDLLGFLLITVNCNMTIVGKIWLIFMILLRMVVIILAGSPVYQDEQERFVCNTLQPGCANVCYDIFSPVSHLRFWLIQSVSVLLPSAVFSVYVVHKGAVLAACGLSGPDGGPTRPDPCDRSPGDRRRPPPCREPRHLTVPDFSSSYIVHLFLRMLTEAAFGASHYLLFGFLVPKRFSCTHSPCTGVVDCYVSRPTEKSIMMLFMWAVSALSLLLSVADLICSVRWRTSGGWGPAEDPPGPAAGRRLSGSLGAKPGQMSRDGGWVEEGAPIHLGLWTGGEGADSPSGKSAVSGRMGLPDEDESEVISSASDKLATTCKEPGSRPHGEVSQDPRGEGPTRSEEHPLASRSRLGRRYPCGQLQPPDGLANSRSRKSEWV